MAKHRTLRKKISTKKGSWWLIGLKFRNRTQQLFLNKDLSHKLHFREKPVLNCLPALCFCHLNQPLIRSSCNSISANRM